MRENVISQSDVFCVRIIILHEVHEQTYRSKVTCTHHHISPAAQSLSVVVCGDDLKLEVGPAHVSEHDGTLDDASVGLNDETVLPLGRGRDDQSVGHLTVVSRVDICSLIHMKLHAETSIGNKYDFEKLPLSGY